MDDCCLGMRDSREICYSLQTVGPNDPEQIHLALGGIVAAFSTKPFHAFMWQPR